ncbi:MAG: phosphate ABC transporter substrate-binding protein [Deltaproteobacteria bacterium]|nr:phosphate ABC transporter substrate-binding protein [Deltaproteobacteria bacterium]
MRIRAVIVLMSILAVFAVSGLCAAGSNVVINGSTTVLPIGQKSAELFMKGNQDVNISVSGGGSGNGIKAIIDGTCDIAMSSRFVKDKEIKLACEKGVYLVPHRVAIDCIVPVVHPSNPLNDIDLNTLKGIYTGNVTNWKALGGSDKPIVVISRDTSSGTYEVWQEKVLLKERVMPRALLQASNGAVAQAVAGNPYAIGYVGIGYLNPHLKGLTVNGVVASPATALNGTFPISRALFMFTNGWPEGPAMSYLNYLLSPAGQKMVETEGFVPLY